jgi:hypothetical protein
MMRFLAFLVAALCWVVPASAQVVGADIVTGCGSITYSAPAAGGNAHMTQDTTGSHCVTAVMTSQYPQGAAALTANAAGSTGAVVGTLQRRPQRPTSSAGSMFRRSAARPRLARSRSQDWLVHLRSTKRTLTRPRSARLLRLPLSALASRRARQTSRSRSQRRPTVRPRRLT